MLLTPDTQIWKYQNLHVLVPLEEPVVDESKLIACQGLLIQRESWMAAKRPHLS
jgi:hypothetical protein